MKERIVLFSDAVIAIILTVMVIELPVKFINGEIDFSRLLQSIAVYLISFCFVANLWFQTAKAFEKVTFVKNKVLIVFLFLLFLLSLVPKATELIIEDTSSKVVLIYGLLTLIVTFLTGQLLLILAKQNNKEHKDQPDEYTPLKKRTHGELVIRLLVLIIAYFYPYVGLAIYSIVPIISFIQNITDEEEAQFVEQLDTDQKKFYLADRSRFWGNPINRYSHLIPSSLASDQFDETDDTENSAAWKKRFAREWEAQLTQQISKIEQAINQTTDAAKIENLKKAKERLEHDAHKIDRDLEKKTQDEQEHHRENTLKHQKKLAKLNEDRAELQVALDVATDPHKKEKITKKLAELDLEEKKLSLEYEKEKRKIETKALEEANKAQKKAARLRR